MPHVILQTACGCERARSIRRLLDRIEVPIVEPFSRFDDLALSTPLKFRTRVFEYYRQDNEFHVYRERLEDR